MRLGSSGTSLSVTTIVFDIGNVLIEWDPRHLYRKIFSDLAQMEWFLRHVCSDEWNLEQDRGRPFAEAVEERIARFPEFAAEIRAYDERWEEMLNGPIGGSVGVLGQLRARGWPIFAITNFSREKYVVACQRFRFLTEFEGTIVSAHERLVKPSAEIFQCFLSRYGRQAEECLFIDDSPANIAAARSLGFHTVHFAGADKLGADLAQLGILP
jgi:2-haloacid dehalogenase